MTPTSSEEQFGHLFVSRFKEGAFDSIVGPSHGPLIGEVSLIQGRPDFVCATYPSRQSSNQRAERIGTVISSTSAANILGHLKPNAGRTIEYVRDKTGLTSGRFQSVVSDLRSEQLIKIERSRNNSELLTSKVPTAELFVFELKLEKWQRAVFQALQYRAAANRVAIVMPSDRIHRIEPHAHKLREFGIGIFSLDWSDGAVRTLIHPKKSRPLSPKHYYVALGNYLRSIPQQR